MLFVTEGKALIEETPKDETGIIVDSVEDIIQGLVREINYRPTDYDSTASAPRDAVKKGDMVWFDKRDSMQMPFNKKLFVINYKNILLIEVNE